MVDDDRIDTILTRMYLEMMGIDKENIVTVNNSHEAVVRAQQELFNVILMDIRLPEMDGIEVAQKIKAHYATSPDLKKIPKIIAYTANQFIGKDKEAQEVFDDMMIKAIPQTEFTQRILAILNTIDMQN
ncbi:MAG: response regulator [bacterium]